MATGDTNLDQLDWEMANQPQPAPEEDEHEEDFPEDEAAMTAAEEADYDRWADEQEARFERETHSALKGTF